MQLCYDKISLDFHQDGNHYWAVLHTEDGKHIYLPRDFIEAAQHGWDMVCPECETQIDKEH